MTNKNKRGLGLKRRLQEANDEERAILRDGLPYAVGFAKPPVHGQFKKGKSGNRRGRPKGSENLGKVAIEELSEMVEINEHGKRRKLPKRGSRCANWLIKRDRHRKLPSEIKENRSVDRVEAPRSRRSMNATGHLVAS
jgi:hypothetical protein